MKIGFIALSGVRCRNEKLMELGLTLPGFVQRSKVIASLPSLGLLTLAGLTPENWESTYIEVADIQDLQSLPGSFDLVAISSFSAQIKEAYKLANLYRATGVKVALGGLHVTACPQEALQHADTIVIGEGEPVWPELLSDLERNRLKPVYNARGRSFNLAEAPMPRFDLLDIQRYNRFTVQTQRGCPYACEFCAASIRLDSKYKKKPVHKVVAELNAIKELWPKPFIEFADDNTFADKKNGRELVKALIPLELQWFTETDISVANDPELLKLMKESGCAQILIGLESPKKSTLDGVERKANWKFNQADRYIDAIGRIQDAGITVNGCFVLGLDNADTTSFDGVLDFVQRSGLYEVQITVMTAFPGTPLYDRLLSENRILKPDAWELCTLFDINYLPKQMTVDELNNGLLDLTQKIYSDDAVNKRVRQFFKRKKELATMRERNRRFNLKPSFSKP
jgi:radical SAM superfamily enzyme YgiQ (UPF0313 family)